MGGTSDTMKKACGWQASTDQNSFCQGRNGAWRSS
jgi:hypothetical protein